MFVWGHFRHLSAKSSVTYQSNKEQYEAYHSMNAYVIQDKEKMKLTRRPDLAVQIAQKISAQERVWWCQLLHVQSEHTRPTAHHALDQAVLH